MEVIEYRMRLNPEYLIVVFASSVAFMYTFYYQRLLILYKPELWLLVIFSKFMYVLCTFLSMNCLLFLNRIMENKPIDFDNKKDVKDILMANIVMFSILFMSEIGVFSQSLLFD